MGIITTKNKRAEKLTDLSGEKSSEPQLVKSLTMRVGVRFWIISFILSFVHRYIKCLLLFVMDSVLAGNPKKHCVALKKASDTVCVGEPSLYNCLSLAVHTLRLVLPSYRLIPSCLIECIRQADLSLCEGTCLDIPAGSS